ncbi:MAG TPA: hypothetical protein VFW86_01780 [Candidatus Limnocylindrales bacterium]|nr:hypothetical protein [Candidatus Limnocylindrales bacterium]
MTDTQGREPLDRAGIEALLAHGGVPAATGAADDLPRYNGLVDPAGAERLATELADRARELSPSTVLVWEAPEDVVLGHVIGRELGLPVVRAYDADGLVGHGPGLDRGARLLLVADAIRDPSVVRAAHSLAEQLGGALLGTAVLVETDALAEAAGLAGTIVGLIVPDPAEPAAERR